MIDDVVEVKVGVRQRATVRGEVLDRIDILEMNIGDIVGEALDTVGHVPAG
ncbi:hypothetical protein [Halalkalicoccus salilacus]|uniref:hypothetical protein n=1 Tax=Halalkalicoccus TaxID=332246 RepID=UPI002F969F73